jgi:hypothetical protein
MFFAIVCFPDEEVIGINNFNCSLGRSKTPRYKQQIIKIGYIDLNNFII